MYYIPGNHDAEILFEPEKCPVISRATNVHQRVIQLKPGLLLAGLGGSLPTQFVEEGQTEMVPVYNPYPFVDENAFKEGLEPLKQKLEENRTD